MDMSIMPKRLETENHNTLEYYNEVLVNHFEGSGLDYSDIEVKRELLKIYPGGKLLDIGCGVSPLCEEARVKENGNEVYGIDFADKLIKRLQEKFPFVNYSVADFYNLPFEDNFFDTVVLGEVIEHAEEPEKVIEEAFRVLKKGRYMALSTPNEETEEHHQYKQHIWSFSKEDIKNLIGEERLLAVVVSGNNLIAYAKKD